MWNNNHVDANESFEKQNARLNRAERRKAFLAWCANHADIALAGFCAGVGLVSTGLKVGGKVYRKHIESREKDYRVYDTSLGRYWSLSRKLTNNDWLQIDERRSKGERLGKILHDLHALK